MGWNFRIMRTDEQAGPFYRIVEVYDNPHGWSEASSPCGETRDELSRDIAWMIKALTLPVIDKKGKEVEPEAILADDLLAAMVGDGPWEKLLSPSEGSA